MEDRNLPQQSPPPQGPPPARDMGTEWLLLVLGIATVVFLGMAVWVSYSGSRPDYVADPPVVGMPPPGKLTLPPSGADSPAPDITEPAVPVRPEKYTPGPKGTPGSESMNP